MQDAIKAMDRAKIELMSKPDTVFFITICFALRQLWDTTIKTACTNGKCIKYNPAFFMSLSLEERVFLVLHETLHVAFMHMCRLKGRNPQKWNMAADYVINDLLILRGFKMPSGGLHDLQYRGMSAEQVYDLIPDSQVPKDFDIDLDSDESEDQDKLNESIQDIVVRAAIQSKIAGDKAGTIPGDIQVYIDRLLTPKLPAKVILARYMNSMAKEDYSWRKPNRRYFPKMIMPTLYSEAMDEIAIAVDISGSVSDADFKRYISEIDPILRHLKPKKLHLIQFDNVIKSVDVLITAADLAKVNFHGRGGTDINPVMEWVNKNKPKVILIFSDGYFNHVPDAPASPVVWLINNNPTFTAPYGKVITYDV